ncbi:hypothetical protein ALC62_05137 [Cyphomyrmex costatus]|uniref:Uncharacterized protein n=1 Tax=Cyphomyrmex costatus TaxID=456900 RepID=A0A195CUL4_9HYME|nr:hypothetical protein ALC62_05137 [Cyphomyrmex costatus]
MVGSGLIKAAGVSGKSREDRKKRRDRARTRERERGGKGRESESGRANTVHSPLMPLKRWLLLWSIGTSTRLEFPPTSRQEGRFRAPRRAKPVREGFILSFMYESRHVGIRISNRGDFASLVRNLLGPIYGDSVMNLLIRQARDILVCAYHGNLENFVRIYLSPAAALLAEVKNVAFETFVAGEVHMYLLTILDVMNTIEWGEEGDNDSGNAAIRPTIKSLAATPAFARLELHRAVDSLVSRTVHAMHPIASGTMCYHPGRGTRAHTASPYGRLLYM